MTVAEVRTQEMWEQESEQMWEDQYPTQPIEMLSNEKRIDAFAKLHVAREEFRDNFLELIGEAGKLVEDTPQGDKLWSLYDQLNDLLYELKDVEREIWRCKLND